MVEESKNGAKVPYEEVKVAADDMKSSDGEDYTGYPGGGMGGQRRPAKPQVQLSQAALQTPGGPASGGEGLTDPDRKQQIDDLCEMFLNSNSEQDLLTREEIEALYTESGFEKAFDLLLIFVEDMEQAQVNHYCYEENLDPSAIGGGFPQLDYQRLDQPHQQEEQWRNEIDE